MAVSNNQKKIREMDQRVITLAEQLIQMPQGLMREGAIVSLATAIQNTIDLWFMEMERPA